MIDLKTIDTTTVTQKMLLLCIAENLAALVKAVEKLSNEVKP